DDVLNASAAPFNTTISVNMNGGDDTLTGTNAFNDYYVTGPDQGTLYDLGSPVNFLRTENIQGATGSDNIHFVDGGSLSGWATGDAGTDTLDYSGVTQDVTVNFVRGEASLVAKGATGFENAHGGLGDDVLVGDKGDNLLAGNGGNDVLIGGEGA